MNRLVEEVSGNVYVLVLFLAPHGAGESDSSGTNSSFSANASANQQRLQARRLYARRSGYAGGSWSWASIALSNRCDPRAALHQSPDG
jgi:hypothetical protein